MFQQGRQGNVYSLVPLADPRVQRLYRRLRLEVILT
jgi:hypothetical protein